jgi:hypothetical protein
MNLEFEEQRGINLGFAWERRTERIKTTSDKRCSELKTVKCKING